MRRRQRPEVAPSRLGFGDWSRFPASARALVVCHPEWRGVRTAAIASGEPVVETATLDLHAEPLVKRAAAAGVGVVVVHGVPPHLRVLAVAAHQAGLRVACILHSSPAQHGGEPWETEAVNQVFSLAGEKLVDRIGFVKAGVAEAFAHLGFDVAHVPNRLPDMGAPSPIDLGEGFHVGVFAEPIFRKNVATQMMAAAMLPEAVVHVLRVPDVDYLSAIPTRTYGVLDFASFQALLASVDLNLYVTLSECHPLTPVESYLAGVPCLVAPNSELFLSDRRLRELTVVDELDDPSAIARAAARLHADRDKAVGLARVWLAESDGRARAAWHSFVSDW